MAEISGGLFGVFIVGMLFFVEAGFRSLGFEREVVATVENGSSRRAEGPSHSAPASRHIS